jgi:hypothetical protein
MIPIANVVTGVSALSGLLSPLAKLGQQEEATETTAAVSTTETQTADAALRAVLARYDVTQITPSQFAQMLEEIRSTGALSDSDLSQLGEVLQDLENESIDEDEQVDLVQFYTDKLDELQDKVEMDGSDEDAFSGVATSLAAVQNRLSWVTRFSLVHADPDAVGIDLQT